MSDFSSEATGRADSPHEEPRSLFDVFDDYFSEVLGRRPDLSLAKIGAVASVDPVYVLSGMFYVSESGWGMVKVPNALVQGLFSAIDVPGAEMPPGKDGVPYQAHISVMRPAEIERIGGPQVLTERGKRFRYQLGPICATTPLGWPEMSRVWFINVKSPALSLLRRSYGLPSLPTHESGAELPFHITVAVRRRNVLGSNPTAKG